MPRGQFYCVNGHLCPASYSISGFSDDHKDLWLDHYRKVFPIYYRSMFKAFRTNENAFCVAPKKSTNLRRAFLEDHFHTLLEDANKITLLIQRGEWKWFLGLVRAKGGNLNRKREEGN